MTKQEEIREGMQRLWCQHCKALQKTNNTVVECWYNPLTEEGRHAFCGANEDAVNAILKDESERGVVIKVDRELPNNPYFGYELWDKESHDRELGYKEAQQDMLEAGYAAFEPLIRD